MYEIGGVYFQEALFVVVVVVVVFFFGGGGGGVREAYYRNFKAY